MNLVKKILCIISVISILITLGSFAVSADEGIGDKLGINNDDANFSELVFTKNGKTYLPLRLVFPNLNDEVNRKGMTISWGTTFEVIHIIYGNTTGGKMNEHDDGSIAPPYVDWRKCIDIMWDGDAINGVKPTIDYIEYRYKENGIKEYKDEDDLPEIEFDDLVYLRNVEGGSRMFASIDDIRKIAEALSLGEEYSVKLYDIN